jgi:hypothetical protein
MGTFAESAIVDYHVCRQGKQTSVFRFRLQQKNGSFPFPFSFAENKHQLSFSICGILET